MARREKPPPLNVAKDESTLEVYSPISDKWLPCWVEDDVLLCVIGPVPRHLPLRMDDGRQSKLDSERWTRLLQLVRKHGK